MQTEVLADALFRLVNLMNEYINKNGKIQPSSAVIKEWHTYDNKFWQTALTAVKKLNDKGLISLPNFTEEDVEFLLDHIKQYGEHHHNLLYPTIDDTKIMPSRLTHVAKHKYQRTIKSRTFRTMMNVRESLNRATGIELPNEDGSKGGLNPTPFDTLFDR